METSPPFQLFSAIGGLGFLETSTPPCSAEPPPPPPPPPVEVFPSQVPSSVNYTVEPVNLDGLTLVKGRVSMKEILGLPNLDLVPGVYEGGLKLWEGSLDLVRALQSEIESAHLSFKGKRVLELGCGHGLPGIFACLKGANVVHFQDFNAEVLHCLTSRNANANLLKKCKAMSDEIHPDTGAELRYFAGDWSQIHQCLPHVRRDCSHSDSGLEQNQASGYDIILMAETIYSVSAQQSLYGLLEKSLAIPHGVVYLSAKKHYFGVGGGTRQFVSLVDKEGFLVANLIAEVADGLSNVREVWKLSVK